jgi:hypothetical protein
MMTDRELLEAIEPMSILNAWVRSPWESRREMYSADAVVYAFKRRLIQQAAKLGMTRSRIVAVERPCKTCDPKAPGCFRRYDRYDSDYWEYEDCRRCAGTGRVTLRFVETNIAGRVTWHTPRPKADFYRISELQWQHAQPTDWEPNQPGQTLDYRQARKHLNHAERIMLGRFSGVFARGTFTYSLYLGDILDCFVCGRPAANSYGFAYEIFRPGLKWRQTVCDDCRARADRWPLQWPFTRRDRVDDYHPRWYARCPLPAYADAEIVTEWLQRRGIRIGQIPNIAPHNYALEGDTLEFVRVMFQRSDGYAMVENCQSSSPWYKNCYPVRADRLRPYLLRRLTSGGNQ